jgi:hypothetical protein
MAKKKESNVIKARKRMSIVENTLNLFKQFDELGYKNSTVIHNQLMIYFSKYENNPYKKYFTLLWNFKSYQSEVINDLEAVLKKLNR